MLPPERLRFINEALHERQAELELIDASTATYRLTVDGIAQSQICLSAPGSLAFDYLRVIERAVVDFVPTGRAFTALHLGIGAGGLVRALVDRYPRSMHILVEEAADICEPVIRALPLPRHFRGEVFYEEARRALDWFRVTDHGPFDVAIIDLWSGSRVDARVSSLEFYRSVERQLADTALLVVNVPDEPDCGFSRSQAATLRSLFPELSVAPHRALEEDCPGNVLFIASRKSHGGSINRLGDIRSWVGADSESFLAMDGQALTDWIGDAEVTGDDVATGSPQL